MSVCRMSGRILAVTAAWFCVAGGARGDEAKKAGPISLNDLSMEVGALQTLHFLRLTRPQLEKLKELAKGTADKARRERGQASAQFRQTLIDLRAALTQDKDDERIEDLMERLDDMHESEKPELDDAVEISDQARSQAPAALKLLTARQVAAYLGSYGEDIVDPRERLLEALGKVRDLGDQKWQEFRSEVAEEIGWLAAGLDIDQAERVRDRVVQLLIVARGLKDKEFKKQRGELEKKARQIVGDLSPTDVLRHVMEHQLAELLSNPRLEAALEARLK